MTDLEVEATKTHSIRCQDSVWLAAKATATKNGISLNKAIEYLMVGFTQGIYELPEITVKYTPPKQNSLEEVYAEMAQRDPDSFVNLEEDSDLNSE